MPIPSRRTDLYRQIVEEYPDSPHANQAKTRLAELEKARQIFIKDTAALLSL